MEFTQEEKLFMLYVFQDSLPLEAEKKDDRLDDHTFPHFHERNIENVDETLKIIRKNHTRPSSLKTQQIRSIKSTPHDFSGKIDHNTKQSKDDEAQVLSSEKEPSSPIDEDIKHCRKNSKDECCEDYPANTEMKKRKIYARLDELPPCKMTKQTVCGTVTMQKARTGLEVIGKVEKKAGRGRPKRDKKEGWPKRPLSAYNYFFKQERNKILARESGKSELLYSINQNDINHTNLYDHRLEFGPSEHNVEEQPPEPSRKGKHEQKRKRRGRPPCATKRRPNPHGIIGFETLTRTVANRWKNAPKDVKDRLSKIAAKDKERYEMELKVFLSDDKCDDILSK